MATILLLKLNYNGYRDSDLDLDLDWEQFSELVT